MTKGNKSKFTKKDELNNQVRKIETNSDNYLDASKGYDEDKTFTEHFALFLANEMQLPTSADENSKRFGIDINEDQAVNQPKYEYLKKQWESTPKENQAYLVGQYVNYITEAKEGEEKLGFAKNEQGKFDFPKHFKEFLQKRVDQDWKNNSSEKDVNEYWASKGQNGKDDLIDQYEKLVHRSKPKGKDLSDEELQEWRNVKLNDLHSRYDKRSKEGIAALESVMEYTLSGKGAVKESASVLGYTYNLASSAVSEAATVASNVVLEASKMASSVASSALGLVGLSSLFGPVSATSSKEEAFNSEKNDLTRFPTRAPTLKPTSEPTLRPTRKPTKIPTSLPTGNPTGDPTFIDNNPRYNPETGELDSVEPTSLPSFSPTSPTSNPTYAPTLIQDNPCFVNRTINGTITGTIDCPPEKQPESFWETPGGSATAGLITVVSLSALLGAAVYAYKKGIPGTSCKPKGHDQVKQNETEITSV